MDEFEYFFNSYVQNMMLADVSREIAAAQRDENAGNFLSALGLLCYTSRRLRQPDGFAERLGGRLSGGTGQASWRV
jgi:hypothetical protein